MNIKENRNNKGILNNLERSNYFKILGIIFIFLFLFNVSNNVSAEIFPGHAEQLKKNSNETGFQILDIDYSDVETKKDPKTNKLYNLYNTEIKFTYKNVNDKVELKEIEKIENSATKEYYLTTVFMPREESLRTDKSKKKEFLKKMSKDLYDKDNSILKNKNKTLTADNFSYKEEKINYYYNITEHKNSVPVSGKDFYTFNNDLKLYNDEIPAGEYNVFVFFVLYSKNDSTEPWINNKTFMYPRLLSTQHFPHLDITEYYPGYCLSMDKECKDEKQISKDFKNVYEYKEPFVPLYLKSEFLFIGPNTYAAYKLKEEVLQITYDLSNETSFDNKGKTNDSKDTSNKSEEIQKTKDYDLKIAPTTNSSKYISITEYQNHLPVYRVSENKELSFKLTNGNSNYPQDYNLGYLSCDEYFENPFDNKDKCVLKRYDSQYIINKNKSFIFKLNLSNDVNYIYFFKYKEDSKNNNIIVPVEFRDKHGNIVKENEIVSNPFDESKYDNLAVDGFVLKPAIKDLEIGDLSVIPKAGAKKDNQKLDKINNIVALDEDTPLTDNKVKLNIPITGLSDSSDTYIVFADPKDEKTEEYIKSYLTKKNLDKTSLEIDLTNDLILQTSGYPLVYKINRQNINNTIRTSLESGLIIQMPKEMESLLISVYKFTPTGGLENKADYYPGRSEKNYQKLTNKELLTQENYEEDHLIILNNMEIIDYSLYQLYKLNSSILDFYCEDCIIDNPLINNNLLFLVKDQQVDPNINLYSIISDDTMPVTNIAVPQDEENIVSNGDYPFPLEPLIPTGREDPDDTEPKEDITQPSEPAQPTQTTTQKGPDDIISNYLTDLEIISLDENEKDQIIGDIESFNKEDYNDFDEFNKIINEVADLYNMTEEQKAQFWAIMAQESQFCTDLEKLKKDNEYGIAQINSEVWIKENGSYKSSEYDSGFTFEYILNEIDFSQVSALSDPITDLAMDNSSCMGPLDPNALCLSKAGYKDLLLKIEENKNKYASVLWAAAFYNRIIQQLSADSKSAYRPISKNLSSSYTNDSIDQFFVAAYNYYNTNTNKFSEGIKKYSNLDHASRQSAIEKLKYYIIYKTKISKNQAYLDDKTTTIGQTNINITDPFSEGVENSKKLEFYVSQDTTNVPSDAQKLYPGGNLFVSKDPCNSILSAYDPNYCAGFAVAFAKGIFNIDYQRADAWNLRNKEGNIVIWKKENKDLDPDLYGDIPPGAILGIYTGDGEHKPYSHVVTYVGDIKIDGEELENAIYNQADGRAYYIELDKYLKQTGNEIREILYPRSNLDNLITTEYAIYEENDPMKYRFISKTEFFNLISSEPNRKFIIIYTINKLLGNSEKNSISVNINNEYPDIIDIKPRGHLVFVNYITLSDLKLLQTNFYTDRFNLFNIEIKDLSTESGKYNLIPKYLDLSALNNN
jgi:hypothetical protein